MPAGKRTAPSLPIAAISSLCPLLRLLGRDTGAQFALCKFLTLHEIAPLHASCRHWRSLLERSTLTHNRALHLMPSQLPLFLGSSWACKHVDALELEEEPHGRRDALELRLVRQALLLIPPGLPRLRRLALNIFVDGLAASDYEICFLRLAGTLEILGVEIESVGDTGALSLILRHVGHLKRLHTLSLGHDLDSSALDFSTLPTLPRLADFSLASSDFRCSAEQVRYLTQCRSLTSLDCGVWSPEERDEEDDEERPDDEEWRAHIEQQLEEGIGALARAFAPSACASRTVAAASSSAAPAPSPSSLRHLDFEGTTMTREVWRHVSRLTGLRTLQPDQWGAGFTEEECGRLADFHWLEALSLRTYDDTLLARFLPSILRCSALTNVSLGDSGQLRTSELADLVRCLPLLRSLRVWSVAVESVAPLGDAPSITHLHLRYCTDLHGNPPHFRQTLPVMPALTNLLLFDTEDTRLSAEEAAPMHAALLQRMPQLTPANFKCNLRSASVLDDGDGDMSQGSDMGDMSDLEAEDMVDMEMEAWSEASDQESEA